MTGLVLHQLLVVREVPPAVRAEVDGGGMVELDVVGQLLPQVSLKTK